MTPTVILALASEESKAKVTCHYCRIDCSKAGKRRDGLQRYRCGKCGKTYSEHKEFDCLFGHKQAVPDEKALLALQLLVEGNSIRSVERITGLHRDTIMKLLVDAGERCEALLATKIRNVPVADVHCDEIWTFCYKKESRRVYGRELPPHRRCLDVHRYRARIEGKR